MKSPAAAAHASPKVAVKIAPTRSAAGSGGDPCILPQHFGETDVLAGIDAADVTDQQRWHEQQLHVIGFQGGDDRKILQGGGVALDLA